MEFKQGSTLHRYSALFILILLMYLLASAVLFLLELQTEAKEQYEDAQFQLQKYQNIADSIAKHQVENETLAALLVEDERYLSAKNKSLAGAKIQQDLRQIIDNAGAKLISMQAVNTQDDEEIDVQPVTVKLRLRLDDESLVKVLHELESRTPLGFVYNLKIQRKTSRANRNKNKTETSILDTHIEYTSFMERQDDV